MEVYKQWMELLMAEAGRFAIRRMSVSMEEQIEFYRRAGTSLDRICSSLGMMAKLPAVAFAKMWQELEKAFRLASTQHPCKLALGGCAGAAPGAIALSRLNLHVASVALGGAHFCIGGMLAGGLVGLAVVLVCVGLFEAWRWRSMRNGRDADSARKRRHLEQKKRLADFIHEFHNEDRLQPAQIDAFDNAFEDLFVRSIPSDFGPDAGPAV
jgi:hypothetical protein